MSAPGTILRHYLELAIAEAGAANILRVGDVVRELDELEAAINDAVVTAGTIARLEASLAELLALARKA